jgi:hypothetical protein
VIFAICAKTLAMMRGLLPANARMERFFRIATLERGLMAGVAALVIGLVLLASAVNQWRLHDFGNLDYVSTMRVVVPGVLFTAAGVQTMLGSFLVTMLRAPHP